MLDQNCKLLSQMLLSASSGLTLASLNDDSKHPPLQYIAVVSAATCGCSFVGVWASVGVAIRDKLVFCLSLLSKDLLCWIKTAPASVGCSLHLVV